MTPRGFGPSHLHSTPQEALMKITFSPESLADGAASSIIEQSMLGMVVSVLRYGTMLHDGVVIIDADDDNIRLVPWLTQHDRETAFSLSWEDFDEVRHA
jgi:hypothetical protein